MTSKYSTYIFLILSALIWGAATPIIRATVQSIPPLTFLMLRFWITSVFCIPAAFFILRNVKLDLKRFVLIFKAALLGHVLALIFIFIGLTKIASIEGSLITTFSPIMVMILGFFLLRENINRKEIEGSLLAFLGAVLIVFEPFITGSSIFGDQKMSFIGSLLFLIGVILDATYTIYVKKNISEDRLITPFIQIIFSFCFAAIIFTLLGFSEQFYLYKTQPLEQTKSCTQTDIDKYNYSKGISCDEKGCSDNKTPSEYYCIHKSYKLTFWAYFQAETSKYLKGNSIYGVLYMAIFSGIVAYTFYNIGLSRIEASEASVFYYLQPIFGIPLGMFLLNEHISLVFIASAILITLGVFMVEKK